MDKKDKLFALIVVVGLIVISVFYEWISHHWDSLKWPALGLLLTLVAFSENGTKRKRLSKYAEARRLFSQQAGGHRWLKIYYAAYVTIVAIGIFCAAVGKFAVVDFFIHGGLFLLIGALLFPIVMLGLMGRRP